MRLNAKKHTDCASIIQMIIYSHNHNALLFFFSKCNDLLPNCTHFDYFSTCLILYRVIESNLKENCFNDRSKRAMFVKKKCLSYFFCNKFSVNLKEKIENKLLGESLNFWY